MPKEPVPWRGDRSAPPVVLVVSVWHDETVVAGVAGVAGVIGMDDEVDAAESGGLMGHLKRVLLLVDIAVLAVDTDETDEKDAHERAGEMVWLRCRSKEAALALSRDGKTG